MTGHLRLLVLGARILEAQSCEDKLYVYTHNLNFDPNDDRLDEWWVKVWDMLEMERGERPRVLINLTNILSQ